MRHLALVLLAATLAQPGLGEQPAPANTDTTTPGQDWNSTGTPADDPWSEIEQFHNRMDQLFAQGFDQTGGVAFSAPNMDVRDEKDHYKVVVDMPGADKEKINVHVEGNILSVSGQRDTSNEVKKDDRVIRDERSEARFERMVTLPGPVKSEALKTTYANGVLTIILPKAEGKTATSPPPSPPIHPPSTTPPNLWIGFPPGMGIGPNDDPMDQFEELHNRMDQLFADTFSQSDLNGLFKEGTGGIIPSLDLRDDKDHYDVRIEMPGADKASIKVKVEGRFLSVTGQRDTADETKQDGHVIRSERSIAQFERSITLPGPVKASAVDAHYDNGVLTLRLPKDEAATEATEVPVH